MNRIRLERNGNYTTISNVFLRDTSLSLKAKGLLAMVMGLPENWDFTVQGMVSICKEGKAAMYATISELIAAGYCRRQVLREGARIAGWEYLFLENPDTEKPLPENPDTGFQDVDFLLPENQELENPTQLKKEKSNKEESIKDTIKTGAVSGNSVSDQGPESKTDSPESPPLPPKEKISAKKEKVTGSPPAIRGAEPYLNDCAAAYREQYPEYLFEYGRDNKHLLSVVARIRHKLQIRHNRTDFTREEVTDCFRWFIGCRCWHTDNGHNTPADYDRHFEKIYAGIVQAKRKEQPKTTAFTVDEAEAQRHNMTIDQYIYFVMTGNAPEGWRMPGSTLPHVNLRYA